jgi:hypothetical protein
MITHEFELEYDSNEDSDEGSRPGIQVEGESEFGDTELENLHMLMIMLTGFNGLLMGSVTSRTFPKQ